MSNTDKPIELNHKGDIYVLDETIEILDIEPAPLRTDEGSTLAGLVSQQGALAGGVNNE